MIAAENLLRDPFPPGVIKLSGSSLFRIRIGPYRIIYVVLPDEIDIVSIDKRERAYS